MENQTCVAIGACNNPSNFRWYDDIKDLDLEQVGKDLGVEEFEIVDVEGPFSHILKYVHLSDLVEIHEVLVENYDTQLHLYVECIGVNYALSSDLREIALECSNLFCGVWDSFEEYLETQLDGLGEVPDWIRPYLDIEKYARDESQDYVYTDTADGCVAIWRVSHA